MRSVRVRVSRPKQVRDQSRATKRRNGVVQFRNNAQGRIAKIEKLADTRAGQGNMCALCSQFMDLNNCKFVSDKFEEGLKPEVVHKLCP